jgi:hypothetical protein
MLRGRSLATSPLYQVATPNSSSARRQALKLRFSGIDLLELVGATGSQPATDYAKLDHHLNAVEWTDDVMNRPGEVTADEGHG